jgi:hypothetical protein
MSTGVSYPGRSNQVKLVKEADEDWSIISFLIIPHHVDNAPCHGEVACMLWWTCELCLREFYTPGRSNQVEFVTGEEPDKELSIIPFFASSLLPSCILRFSLILFLTFLGQDNGVRVALGYYVELRTYSIYIYTHMIPTCPRRAFWGVRPSWRSKEGQRRLILGISFPEHISKTILHTHDPYMP